MNRLTVVCIFTIIVCVFGHAKLEYPKPYNPNPSTASPCGGGQALTLPAAVWTQQDVLNISWTVVASDGNGQVIMTIDTTGGTTFGAANPGAVQISLLGNNPTSGANKNYIFTFTVPASLTCTSANKMCPVQVHSPNWFACTTVEVRDYVPPNAGGSTGTAILTADVNAVKCQTITPSLGVVYCDGRVGTDVQIGDGETPYGVDQYVQSTFYLNINNTNVFLNGTSNPACARLYKDFLCDASFPPCGTAVTTGLRTSGSCRQQCIDAMTACGVTSIHSGLYNCDLYPLVCAGCRSVMSLMATILLPLIMAVYNRL